MDASGGQQRRAAGQPRAPGRAGQAELALARAPLLDTPDSALNKAFAWAAGRMAGAVRADPVSARAGWDAADFALLLEEGRAFQRVGPRALRDPEGFLHEVVAGLFGVRADTEGGRFAVSPWMPDGWRSMAIRRVRLHRTLVDVDVRPRAEWATVRVNLTFGPPIALALSVRNAGPVGRITVDETALEGDRAIFSVSGEHEAMFFFEGGIS